MILQKADEEEPLFSTYSGLIPEENSGRKDEKSRNVLSHLILFSLLSSIKSKYGLLFFLLWYVL
jgi:hypothetical protein